VRLLFAAVGGLSRLGAALGSLATIVTLGLVALSVFARYALGRPMPWIDEVAGWFVVALVMLAVAEAQARGEHIGIDPPARIAASRLGRGLRLLGTLSVVATAAILLREGVLTVEFSRMVGIATEIEGVPIWWVHLLIPIGAGLLLLVALAQLCGMKTTAAKPDFSAE
jgi:TRAP-type C4-dicarboxylate transport system permease small subunit